MSYNTDDEGFCKFTLTKTHYDGRNLIVLLWHAFLVSCFGFDDFKLMEPWLIPVKKSAAGSADPTITTRR